MSKSEKFKFDRESNFEAKYLLVYRDVATDFQEKEVGTVEFKATGEVIMKCEGFEHRITNVDEMEVTISPMDGMFSKATFKIKKIDDSTTTLPHKFYGIRGTNIILKYDSEIGGSDELPNE